MVVGLVWVATHELRLFKVDRQDAATLGPIITANVKPGTTVIRDEWAAYNCLPALADPNRVNMSLVHLTVNHSINFVNPAASIHTQNIESAWQKVEHPLIRRGRKLTPRLATSHLARIWWELINSPLLCEDPFIEAVARHYLL